MATILVTNRIIRAMMFPNTENIKTCFISQLNFFYQVSNAFVCTCRAGIKRKVCESVESKFHGGNLRITIYEL
mgnify:CR=1 FL=1